MGKYLYRLRKWPLVHPNFRGDLLPLGVGIFFALGQGIYLLGRWFVGEEGVSATQLQYFLLITMVGLVGFVDDRWGGREVKGLRGHFQQLVQERRISTGMWKVIVIAFAAGIAVYRADHAAVWWLSFLLLMLTSNLFNLLDVRPGRAGKMFLAVALLLGSTTGEWPFIFGEWSGVWLTWLLLFPGELRGKWMLGDAGSNLVGFICGVWMMRLLPPWLQLGVVFLLLWIHWFAEQASIGAWIEERSWVRRLDEWGRIR